MRLSELTAGLPVRVAPGAAASADSEADPEVTGVGIDSRRIEPGDLFVAVPGERFDGRRFAGQAVAAGAVAVLAAPGEPPAPWVGTGAPPVPWRIADDPRALAGPLAARLLGHPERELVMAAVTGTNGKSTVATLVAAILEAAGHPTALLGTLGYGFRGDSFAASRTTPEAPETLRLLRRWRDQGAEAASMEASSHALALERLSGLAFDVAAFTNLTQDHFDYHRDFASYFAAKRRLFDLLKPGGRAVVNADDPFGRRLADELPDALSFGDAGTVRPRRERLDEGGIRATVETPRGDLEVRSPLLGRYNLANLLAAIAAGEALGLEHRAIASGVAGCGPIPGRLEPVDCGQPFPVYVDYAHTPAALESALSSVTELSGRRLIVIFGAGGDRDRSKRAPMGRVVGELAALPILTSDNPRGEDPLEIIQAVEEGLKEAGNTEYRIVPDRREAIRRAIAVAGPDDAVLVAGKGHEQVQEIGDQKLPFSDRQELESALEERFGQTANR